MAVLKNNCSFFFIAKKNESFKTSGIHIFFHFKAIKSFIKTLCYLHLVQTLICYIYLIDRKSHYVYFKQCSK